jgi:hypothetical protein
MNGEYSNDVHHPPFDNIAYPQPMLQPVSIGPQQMLHERNGVMSANQPPSVSARPPQEGAPRLYVNEKQFKAIQRRRDARAKNPIKARKVSVVYLPARQDQSCLAEFLQRDARPLHPHTTVAPLAQPMRGQNPITHVPPRPMMSTGAEVAPMKGKRV